MDPYEQRLRDEVIYLHSLWHRGPPRNPNPVPIPPTYQQPHFPLQHFHSSSSGSNTRRNSSPNLLHISNPTTFKRNHKGLAGKYDSLTAALDGGKEWPVTKIMDKPSSDFKEWPSIKPKAPKTLPTPEEAALQRVLQMQYRVLDEFGEFLTRTAGSDSDEEEDEEDDDVASNAELEESEEYKFFLGVFVKDKELREYYEKNSAAGDFCCFVCGSDKKRGIKKFKSCEGLLRHSISIAKTNRRLAHRALGLVVCKVLGWDVDRLPLIVVKDKPLSLSLTSLVDMQCERKENMELKKDVSMVVPSECKFEEAVDVKKDDDSASNSDALQCENAEIADVDKNVLGDADTSVENVNVNRKNSERKEEGALDEKQEHSDISVLEESAPGEIIASGSTENLVEGNGDMAVNKEEPTDKMDNVPSGVEWPCRKVTTSPSPALREWPTLPLDSSDIPVSAEETAKIAAEQKVLEACLHFFRSKNGYECDDSDPDEDNKDMMDEDDDDEDDDDDGDCEDGESEELKFFIKLFTDDAKLRNYYEKCHGDGDFLCLVCAGVKKKTWRRFKGCIGLLHHSNTVWKTEKKAHRDYARAVCKVLGWDINQLPKIVCVSEPLSLSLSNQTTLLDSVAVQTSGAGWPCEGIKDVCHPQTSDWPNVKPVNDSVSDEEKEKAAAEQKILEACRDFFRSTYASQCDEDENEETDDMMNEEDEEEEDDDGDGVSDGESEEFKFFQKLFTENANLRSYYEKSHGDGDFLCLVCGAVKKKAWRRFKGCIGLLHHSNTVWKVKKKAHRAYARAVCYILGWDIESLPRIVSLSEPVDQSIDGTQDSVPLPATNAEWPCKPTNEIPKSWPSPKLPLESVSAEEKEKLAAEQKILEACRSFLFKKYGPELDEDDSDKEGDDWMDEVDEEEDEDITSTDPYESSEEFKFFVNLFTEDEKLMSFYKNNHENGDFCCLVCAAVGKKAWKRFKGCAGLLNHANTVLSTMRKAHRAYARAVCKIPGWDIKQLPRIVHVEDPSSGSLPKSDVVEDDGVIIASEKNSEQKENSRGEPGGTAF